MRKFEVVKDEFLKYGSKKEELKKIMPQDFRWDGKGFHFIPQFLNRWRTFSQVLTYFFSSGKSKKNGENRRGRSVDYYPSQDKQLHLQKVD